MSPFEVAPEFIELDNRLFRGENPISIEQMRKKHEVLFPESLVKGKTILDLGSCMGATGHWCLSMGAAHYIGVELQESYATKAKELLEKYHSGKFSIEQMSIEDWFAKSDQQFDIVSILGVIYVFVDYYSILKALAARAKETILIEGMYHDRFKEGVDFVGVQFVDQQPINLSDENSSLIGRGTRIAPKGLAWLMAGLSFGTSEVLKPKPIIGSKDVYTVPIQSSRPARYLMKFTRTVEASPSLSEDLSAGQVGLKKAWDKI